MFCGVQTPVHAVSNRSADRQPCPSPAGTTLLRAIAVAVVAPWHSAPPHLETAARGRQPSAQRQFAALASADAPPRMSRNQQRLARRRVDGSYPCVPQRGRQQLVDASRLYGGFRKTGFTLGPSATVTHRLPHAAQIDPAAAASTATTRFLGLRRGARSIAGSCPRSAALDVVWPGAVSSRLQPTDRLNLRAHVFATLKLPRMCASTPSYAPAEGSR